MEEMDGRDGWEEMEEGCVAQTHNPCSTVSGEFDEEGASWNDAILL